MPRISDAIKTFLSNVQHNCPEMASWYNASMEVQVLVAAGDGELVAGKRNTWSNGLIEWSHIRMPKNSDTDPISNDYEIRFPLHEHVEYIGLTGWQWSTKKSLRVGFDFDAITSHAGSGVTNDELNRVREAVEKIPEAWLFRSTGGLGLHLYLMFDPDNAPHTNNHHEHAALARACLGKLSNMLGYPFEASLDVMGGNMWIWSRKTTEENQGLSLIKRGIGYFEPPEFWMDHIDVVKRKRTKVQIRGVDSGEEDDVENIAASRRVVPLDVTHKRIIEELQKLPYSTFWVPDHNLLQTHTCALVEVQKLFLEQGNPLEGHFETVSNGSDKGKPNCFCFPCPNGAFKVVRFGNNAPEAPTWCQDSKGWTNCYFNRKLDLLTTANIFGGLENPSRGGGFSFPTAADALAAIKSLGGSLVLPNELVGKPATLKTHKDGRLVLEVKCKSDEKIPGFIDQAGKFTKILNISAIPSDSEEESQKFDINKLDQMTRALLTANFEEAGWGWFDQEHSRWVRQPKDNIRSALKAQNFISEDAEKILGHSVIKAWTIVNIPFAPEYPGGRQWNMNAAQFRFTPEINSNESMHPHWNLVLDHCGEELTQALKNNNWARKNGIATGRDYLTYWIASMFKYPFEPLPYLFFFGPQNSGKSIFHEAIALLVKDQVGIIPADHSLTSSSGFNGELANAFLCVVEETDLSKDKSAAYNRIKDWVTSPIIAIRAMRQQVYKQKNTTHWVQCSNPKTYCPVFPGDTRITMSYVPELQKEIPKHKLLALLEAEAPHFMSTLLSIKLPEAEYRMRIPAIMTSTKEQAESANCNSLESYLREFYFYAPGLHLSFSTFFEQFYDSLPSFDKQQWTERRVLQEMPANFPIGRYTGNKQYIGNISTEELNDPPAFKFTVQNGKLVKV